MVFPHVKLQDKWYTYFMEETEVKYVSLFDYLKSRSFSRGKKKSERHLLLEEIEHTLNIPHKYMKGYYFQCKNLTDAEIREAFDSARKWKINPSALFRKLIKEKSAEVKKKLTVITQW